MQWKKSSLYLPLTWKVFRKHSRKVNVWKKKVLWFFSTKSWELLSQNFLSVGRKLLSFVHFNRPFSALLCVSAFANKYFLCVYPLSSKNDAQQTEWDLFSKCFLEISFSKPLSITRACFAVILSTGRKSSIEKVLNIFRILSPIQVESFCRFKFFSRLRILLRF